MVYTIFLWISNLIGINKYDFLNIQRKEHIKKQYLVSTHTVHQDGLENEWLIKVIKIYMLFFVTRCTIWFQHI